MLTRAYDTIMATLQTPAILSENVDYKRDTIDDGYLNCKTTEGSTEMPTPISGRKKDTWIASSAVIKQVPLAVWAGGTTTVLSPDESETPPDYEDYSGKVATDNGWTSAAEEYEYDKEYDAETKEFVCRVGTEWKNTSGTSKTVYGVSVIATWGKRDSYSALGSFTSKYLICREHFPSPVVVEDQENLRLTFTWRVGRAGLVSNTSAAAE